MVFLKFLLFLLCVIGHLKALSEGCSHIELFEVRDDLWVHGLEKRCCIMGRNFTLMKSIPTGKLSSKS